MTDASTTPAADADGPVPGRIGYSERRRRQEKAASYNVKYEAEFHKRLSDRREKRLLERLLEPLGQVERLLDVPCGAGRLSGVLARHARRVWEVDYSFPMLEFCRDNAQGYRPLLANANAFALPFADGVVDLVVSIRLNHHIPERRDRLRHVQELCRVSRRYVLLTFFDESGLKNIVRRAKARLGSGKRAKKTLTLEEVRTMAADCGFRVREARPLAPLLSGHVFTLLEKAPSA